MNETTITIIISALSGLIGVLVGSAKPLVDWHIEKKRDSRKERKLLIKEWRQTLRVSLSTDTDFLATPSYLTLRPYLIKSEINQLERTKTNITIRAFSTGLSADEDLNLINTVIDRLEDKWGLK